MLNKNACNLRCLMKIWSAVWGDIGLFTHSVILNILQCKNIWLSHEYNRPHKGRERHKDRHTEETRIVIPAKQRF